jgi:pSer/pThr/pTyr-binding forkhead associated (FHA) protein
MGESPADEGDGALLILRLGSERREWSLSGVRTIGRDAGSDIHLPDRQVSRRHAIIRRAPGGHLIEDLGSTNGTWVNGVAVEGPVRLSDGDEISVAARYKLVYVDADATTPLLFEGRGLRIDTETMMVYVNGEPLDPVLSGPQFELLRLLYGASGTLVARDEIVTHVWPDADPGGVSEDAVDALVRRLRLRLADADPEHQYVVTVRGYGFRLDNTS